MEHYYILPNGKRVANMKMACEELGISSHAFRRKIKSGVVKKNNSENNWSKEYRDEISTARSGRTERNRV